MAMIVAALALAVHFRLGLWTWSGDLAGSDETAHYVTGVMAHDYLRAWPARPIPFAESFYVRFPRVGIGHWPPVFYALQALWYLVFGASIASARALGETLALAFALVVWVHTREGSGVVAATVAAACLLLTQLVRDAAWMVMSDVLTALFVLLAIRAFADYLDSGSRAAAARFAFWGVLAILTKGNAWALGIFALLMPAAARAWRCYLRPSYYICGLAILGLGLPFYLFAASQGAGYPDDPYKFARGAGHAFERLRFIGPTLACAPPFNWVLSALAAVAALLFVWRRETGRRSLLPACAAVWIFAQLLFLFVFPMTQEARYFMPAAGAMFLLLGYGMGLLSGRMAASPRQMPRIGGAAAPFLIAAASVLSSAISLPARTEGYRPLAASIPLGRGPVVILCSLTSSGEGAFIAERLALDPRRDGLILRATKVLSSSGFNGGHYRDRFATPAEVELYLQSIPVDYLVVDTEPTRPDQKLLRAAIDAAPERYRLTGRFPLTVSTGPPLAAIQVYRNVAAEGQTGRNVELDMGFTHRHRTLHWSMGGKRGE
jgi:hypothetical protein